MAKIDELTELLIHELNDFNKGIKRLEQLSDVINETQVSVDVSELKGLLKKHTLQLNGLKGAQSDFLQRFEGLLKGARVYPTWAVIVFMVAIAISVGALLYVLGLA